MADNWKNKGELSQAKVMATLLEKGKVILLPFGDNQRYDLVIDEGGTLVRVQVKTGRVKASGDTIVFNTCSNHPGPGRRPYKGEADMFGIYCPETATVYMVPVADCGATEAHLRIAAPRSLVNRSTIRWAKDYELK